ncbi:hypothetical protein [Pseudorhodoferax sp. Leaf267]|uniref:hypothetical protein n=1 Tax=Pseudorhodoferax sp. Leaf267 TaxID=1736316 RepID=UPI0006F5C232|nr:hypothetical protein [Pseudorhodoferax sp. Leaf267]KQP21477.1 hypothetical protein ASF43_26250 [Pseudorhodoferax sp. Leaf267]
MSSDWSASAAVVGFIANLMPLFTHEHHQGVYSARSLLDGTLVLPLPDGKWSDEDAMVRIHWQGDASRISTVHGDLFATPIVERYVRLHAVGASEEAIAAELWFMANHFTHKTGCTLYLPNHQEPPHPAVRIGRKAMEIGQGILVNLLSPKL